MGVSRSPIRVQPFGSLTTSYRVPPAASQDRGHRLRVAHRFVDRKVARRLESADRPLDAADRRGEGRLLGAGVGYLILKARASAGLTQRELAGRIGTSQPTVARWESGAQVPSVRSLTKIAESTGFRLTVGLRRADVQGRQFLSVGVRRRKERGRNHRQGVRAEIRSR